MEHELANEWCDRWPVHILNMQQDFFFSLWANEGACDVFSCKFIADLGAHYRNN